MTLNWKHKAICALLGLALTSAARAEDAPMSPPHALHYRMTVSIETPDGIKTGSAVRDANALVVPKAAAADKKKKKKTPQAEFEGEAVAVDLGKQGVVFALADHTTGYGLSAEQLRLLPSGDDLKPGVKVTLPEKDYPNFARFEDIEDPLSRTGVLETDSLKIKDVTIEITDAPVTQDLKKSLPWLPCLARWPEDFLAQAQHGRVLPHLYRYLAAGEYEGLRNIRAQRLAGAPAECTVFWHKMYNAFAARQQAPATKDCAPGDDKCNPFDTPENRALFGKKNSREDR